MDADIEKMFYLGKSKSGYSRINSKSIWMSDNDFGVFSNNPKSMTDHYLNLFKHASEKYNHTFRIYLTARGIRAFIIDEINVLNEINILREVNCDPYYVMVVMRDKEFSCRISPKTKKLPEYFAITKYLTTVGKKSSLKKIDDFIKFHDSETKAFSEFQLV